MKLIHESLNRLTNGGMTRNHDIKETGNNVDGSCVNKSEYIHGAQDRRRVDCRKDLRSGCSRLANNSDMESTNSSSTDSEHRNGRGSKYGSHRWMKDFMDGIIETMMSTKHKRYTKPKGGKRGT